MPFTKIWHTARLLGPKRFASLVANRLFQANPIEPWETEPEFLRLANEISDRTLVDRPRLYALYQLVKLTAALPGAVAEVGVYRGGTAKLIARLCAGARPLFLFDTFTGMPDTHPTHDFHRKGDFSDTSEEAVRAYLADCRGVTIHPGFFPASAAPVTEQSFGLVHVDVDIYASVRACCDFFFPRLNRGGVLIFDDYGMITCPGAKRAVDEFCAEKGLAPFYLPTGQCLLFKLG